MAEIFPNLRRCHLQSNNLDKTIFVHTNLPNDPRVCCSSPSSLIQLIEADFALEKELEQYEGEFELDELLNL